MKRRLSRAQMRRLERDGVMGWLRPLDPRPPERTRKVRASAPRRERRGPRGVSLGRRGKLTRAEKWDTRANEWGIIADGISPAFRPEKFSDCRRGPCPYVSCKFHLYLDVDPITGAIKINHPGKEPGDLKKPCALRFSRKVKKTGEETSRRTVAKALNLTSERIRQTEEGAIKKLKVLLDDDPVAHLTGPKLGPAAGGGRLGA